MSMSQLSKSLEKRIQELTASIELQKTELAAYERVLHMEMSNEHASSESGSVGPEVESGSKRKKSLGVEAAGQKSSKKPAKKEARGNKTMMVAEIVEGLGAAGASPKEVDAALTERNISRSKNLVYNTLSYLVAHKRLVRRDGKYFSMRGGSGSAKGAGAKKSVERKTGTTKKRHLSAEGLKRIKDALKKRWSAKKAAASESKKPA